MWNKLKDFTESHYRGVLAVNLAALLFIGTAVFYGVIAVRDISTYDEIIVKADLQPTTDSTDDWFSEVAAEEATDATEATKPKEQVVRVELYDVIEKFLPEGSSRSKNVEGAPNKCKRSRFVRVLSALSGELSQRQPDQHRIYDADVRLLCRYGFRTARSVL